ncbi:hypothetical protein [Pedobacter sp. SYSU D00535]|uniref:hypothetical protein n=1 Tax=Pedobacter sp. SYSU D00535 TaxID=2810308 RepID=UPI001A976F1E|nr:hypothetical protein [Pedobacter sp. SYSU D00535]
MLIGGLLNSGENLSNTDAKAILITVYRLYCKKIPVEIFETARQVEEVEFFLSRFVNEMCGTQNVNETRLDTTDCKLSLYCNSPAASNIISLNIKLCSKELLFAISDDNQTNTWMP